MLKDTLSLLLDSDKLPPKACSLEYRLCCRLVSAVTNGTYKEAIQGMRVIAEILGEIHLTVDNDLLSAALAEKK